MSSKSFIFTSELVSCSLNVTFLLIFFLGNFLRNTSAKVSSGSIPGHGWVFVSFPMEIQWIWKSTFQVNINSKY